MSVPLLPHWHRRDGRGLAKVGELNLASVQGQVVFKLYIQG